ncbi:glycosyl transferase family 41-domain-containing protein [Stachybotrys elegans]|uniref:protein O-GlcNAc transferase n=1 Tax=Stachybotrys elegans TaxID=80388 RepID=A0A8K0SJH8_9HYPO|nr:glycosyl transferase family 41-domain-containing protein [Stachybotrys elegans]
MPPLIQMYSHAVPESPNLDNSTLLSHHHDQPLRDTRAPHQQSFPIRAARTYAAGTNSYYPPLAEHHLRRKTPNGTINAGYDGTPTRLLPGSRPQKHMILPSGANTSSYLPAGSYGFPLHQGTGPNPSVSQDAAWFDASWLPDAGLYTTRNLRQPPGAASQPLHRGYFPNAYQPVMQANDYNVRAFCPPPVPMNETPVFNQLGPWQYQNLGQAPMVGGDHEFAGSNLTPGLMGSLPVNLFSVNAIAGPPIAGSIRQGQLHFTPPIPAAVRNQGERFGGHDAGSMYHHHFKDRALARAHKSYADLLAHLYAARRFHQGKGHGTSQSSSKLMIYPKPPKPARPPSQQVLFKEAILGDAIAPRQFSTVNYSPGTHVQSNDPYCPPNLYHSAHVNGYRHDLSNLGQPLATVEGQGAVGFDEERDDCNSFGKPSSPLANARESLEILNNLCEQSGWKWMDGILLGGCLHYGLEQYEDALQWFSRVMALDSSHVEAITNAAATLFCLNRQVEAEQNWLRAIKLRPDYLEAAEHLVGLLYKKRSKEAVEVINYIQGALKLTQAPMPIRQDPLMPTGYIASKQSEAAQRPTATFPLRLNHGEPTSHETNGFGSSGYALPGSDNGRILALVHAKGTMLYSLKDVSRASEAFEEAVLIGLGWRVKGIQDLVYRIQVALSPKESLPGSQGYRGPLRPLLLPPERARHTANLLFPTTGELPGLCHVPDGPPKRAAIQTTSNSLLSLAKIFQDAMSSGGSDICLRQPSGVGEILALYYLSLSLQESPSTANNVGILLAGVQHSITRSTTFNAPSQPSIPGVPAGSGSALALAYYHYGLRLDPKHVHLHTNLGSLLKDIGQLDLAIQMYERAVACDGTFDIALTNLANAVKDRGRINDAIQYYKRAIEANPDFAEAVCGLLTALNSVCDWRGRGGVLIEGGRYDRWHVDEDGMLLDAKSQSQGSGLTSRVVNIVSQQLGEAALWGRNVVLSQGFRVLGEKVKEFCDEGHLEQLQKEWSGRPWEGSRVLRLVERTTRVILRQWYHDKYIAGAESDSSKYLRPPLPSSLIVPSAPTVLPFHTFTSPLVAADIRAISQRNAMRISCSTLRSTWLSTTVYAPPPPPKPHLNIGYVSSDFNNHPLAHLMQSVFGFHDVNRARAFCYATTASDKSPHRLKIEREAPVFHDASGWPAEKLVRQIVDDGIHILVNLNGYTRGARNEIFAARPAPIQMSFMGFAGTLGAEWCDYILADSIAIPESTLRPWRSNVCIEDVLRDDNEDEGGGWVYSENVIFCRDTFFCCDHAQSCEPSERNITWADEERRRWRMRKELFPALDDDAIILGNFNQLYKIEPTTFRTWLRILAQVPKAVLWLLRFPELGETNLRRTAQRWAGPEVASRLIFTDVAPKSQHIARARVCDLFLDTPECNAHTTAADVLWSSTPLLTLPRYSYKMCSRMAASILHGALPKTAEGRKAATELVVESDDEYERSAVQLAGSLVYSLRKEEDGETCGQGQGRLHEMRRLLWDHRWECGLFNTRRWVADLETAYEEAWRRWVAGQGGDIYL